ncbi:uncharacterized protein LOC116779428 [Danaus plexippus]|uniref:uncharacterized protein LOC116779428 n=1 Tax=Danaus plexippus TaxID=13037 RepID=UPI002AB17755|nr:uncharacterized protein LOC116779428 [Danaus plexippus]
MDSNQNQSVQKSEESLISSDKPSVEENIENCLPVIRDDKSSDSDVNSEDLSNNVEQDNISNSQFYESSDSKLDYAVKMDDNDTLSDIDDIKTDTASADSEDSALGSLPPDSALTDREEDAQDRSDGSDSGLGSETTDEPKLPEFNLQCNNAECRNTRDNEVKFDPISDSDKVEEDKNTETSIKKPQKSNLKRKPDFESNNEPEMKKQKNNIHFNNITVYYFPRTQGFTCVPSQGGSTLGMEWEHSHVQTFTLTEHALEQKRLHRQVLQQLKSERHNLQGVSLSSSEDSDTEEEASDISESELDLDSYYFLQPVPTRQRRALLRAAGVRKIEGYEKDECRDIRTSREFCGCACKGVCNPENCLCSISGIKCQVDRLNFPCGCTRDGCGNETGRIEFNPMRVRTHFINTLMRLGLEKKNEEAQEAVKRKWAEAHISSTCVTDSSYEKENCHIQDNNLASNTNSTPRIGIESCISPSFTGIHHNMNSIPCNNQNDASYNFRNDQTDHRNIKSNNMMNFHDESNHGNHDYTSNILQGKGPPYSSPAMNFNMSNNMQRYPDLNYPYDQQHSDGHLFKGIHSYPASAFEEFAHNSQMTMLNHYGHMYVPEYLHKPSTSMPEHSMQYHMMQQNHYDMYKNPENVNMDNKTDAHYTTLLSMPYQQSNKLQTIENDENWFSHNTLFNLDHSVQVTQEVPVEHSEVTPTLVESEVSDATENFGELIKKTMVESVTV